MNERESPNLLRDSRANKPEPLAPDVTKKKFGREVLGFIEQPSAEDRDGIPETDEKQTE